MYRIDLHTHSCASPDGSLTLNDYERILTRERLDMIAVTDHNTITYAVKLQAHLGDRIIIGEEIDTTEGEIIGLFLHQEILPGQSLMKTVADIKAQQGIVYVPHPFETVRHGLSRVALEQVADQIDIIEAYNGRALFQNKSKQALMWAADHSVAIAASSDAHGIRGWGRTYSSVTEKPTHDTLAGLLREATFNTSKVGVGVLYPKYNRISKRWGKKYT